MVDIKEERYIKTIKNLTNEVEFLEKENQKLKDLIFDARKTMYGKKTEKAIYNQINIFNEAEFNANEEKEPDIEEITYKRERKRKTGEIKGKNDNFSKLEKIYVNYEVEDKVCPICKNECKCIGKVESEKLKYQPEKLYIEVSVQETFACENKCEDEDGKTIIKKAEKPESFIPKSIVSDEFLAHIITSKYLYALPLYRQEYYFENHEINISRQTLSNWILNAAKEFEEFYKYLKLELLKKEYIQADETTVTMIDKKFKESSKKTYMWLYQSGEIEKKIVIFEHKRSRENKHPVEFLGNYKYFLQTDGYTGYDKVSTAKRVYCMAHIRRPFVKIASKLTEEQKENSVAVKVIEYIEKIYKIEKQLKKEYEEESETTEKYFYKVRKNTRIEKSFPIFKELKEYINTEIELVLPESNLGKAMKYAQKHLPSLSEVFNDGRLEIDNNNAERAIKNFVIGRKNWLFIVSKNGAKASSILYSILITAKSNNLKPEKYLVWLMKNLILKRNSLESNFEDILPWSNSLPDDIRLKN
jgi:transposase